MACRTLWTWPVGLSEEEGTKIMNLLMMVGNRLIVLMLKHDYVN